MNVGGKAYRTIWQRGDGRTVEIIDQTRHRGDADGRRRQYRGESTVGAAAFATEHEHVACSSPITPASCRSGILRSATSERVGLRVYAQRIGDRRP